MEWHVEQLNTENADKWEEFNKNSSEGSFFHTLQWRKILERSFQLPLHYFLLFNNNKVFGIFPFVEHRIRFFKGFLPIANSECSNVILKDCNDDSGVHSLFNGLRRSDRPMNSFVVINTLHQEFFTHLGYANFPYYNDGHMILDLKKFPPERIWDSFSAKKGQRTYIRRFDDKGFVIKEADSLDDLNVFYQHYKDNLIHIHVTPCPWSHFQDLHHEFSEGEIRTTLLVKDDTVAGGLMTLLFKPQKTAYFHYLSLNRNLPNTYHPTYYLFWEGINWARDHGFEKISFGRQKLEPDNLRYRIKHEFKAEFMPNYSKMVSLSRLFTVGYTYYELKTSRHEKKSLAQPSVA
jgi:hypothetical protein